MTDIQKAMDLVDEHAEEMIGCWQQLVRIPSPTDNYGGNLEVVEDLQAILEDVSGCPEYTSSLTGCTLMIANRTRADKKPIVFMGHTDTVLSSDSDPDAGRIEDGRMYGPGCLDMKGGLIAIVFATNILYQLRYPRTIKIVLTHDEEKGHTLYPHIEPQLVECISGSEAAFCFETANLYGDLIIGRKGTACCDLEIHGKSAHTGRDFNLGVSAISEAARQIKGIEALTNQRDGITVSVGKISGGTARNCIPDNATMEIDIRYMLPEQLAKIEQSLADITYRNRIAGSTTTTRLVRGLPPMMAVAGNRKLFNAVKEASEDYNLFPIRSAVISGGGGDAAYAVKAHVPVIDQMGVRGEYNHTRREYAVVDSLIDKTKLILATVLDNFY